MSGLRAIAIAAVRRPRDGALLVLDGVDPATGERFFRPLGGGIEFGEKAVETVVRELREEVGAEIADVQQVGLIENLFVLDAKPRHELRTADRARTPTHHRCIQRGSHSSSRGARERTRGLVPLGTTSGIHSPWIASSCSTYSTEFAPAR